MNGFFAPTMPKHVCVCIASLGDDVKSLNPVAFVSVKPSVLSTNKSIVGPRGLCDKKWRECQQWVSTDHRTKVLECVSTHSWWGLTILSETKPLALEAPGVSPAPLLAWSHRLNSQIRFWRTGKSRVNTTCSPSLAACTWCIWRWTSELPRRHDR